MLTKQKIAILNSRQGLYPCRLHAWIQKTLETLTSLKSSQPVILSSIGMSTWDLVTIAASRLQLPLELHIQIKNKQTKEELAKQIISGYKLNPQFVSFHFITENSDKVFQTKRDNTITASADIIFPISIRKKGNLERLISTHQQKVNNLFQIDYKNRTDKIAYTLNHCNLSTEIQNISNKYIIHWTKTSKNKWYYERQYDYYKDILRSDIYPRSAFDSLTNIINLKKIYATPTHMPQNIPTVSFTSLTPMEIVPLFRWRSRYQEMSFEPYGIGIKKEIAAKRNIQKVLYYDKNGSDDISIINEKVWLTQSKGERTNWESENEYRHLGDFHFEDIDKQNIILFTRYKKEADQLQKLTGIQTVSFNS